MRTGWSESLRKRNSVARVSGLPCVSINTEELSQVRPAVACAKGAINRRAERICRKRTKMFTQILLNAQKRAAKGQKRRQHNA